MFGVLGGLTRGMGVGYGQGVIVLYSLLLILAFVPIYIILRVRERSEDKKDPQLGFKSVLYMFEVLSLLIALHGVFLVIDYLLHFMTDHTMDWKEMVSGLLFIVAGGGLFGVFDFFASQTNTAEHWLPRKAFLGTALLIVGIEAIAATSTFLGGLLINKGAAWDVPLAGMLVYGGATFLLLTVYKGLFMTAEGPQGSMASGYLPFGGGGQSAGGFGGSPSMPVLGVSEPQAAPSQPSMPTAQPQPSFGASPAASSGIPGQDLGGGAPAAAPQAPASGQCPTCGGATRFIEQYQRTWCDTCRKYL